MQPNSQQQRMACGANMKLENLKYIRIEATNFYKSLIDDALCNDEQKEFVEPTQDLEDDGMHAYLVDEELLSLESAYKYIHYKGLVFLVTHYAKLDEVKYEIITWNNSRIIYIYYTHGSNDNSGTTN